MVDFRLLADIYADFLMGFSFVMKLAVEI